MAKTPSRQEPERNADFVREVDEELRRDQLKAIWNRFGLYIVGTAVLIVLLTAGYRGYNYVQAKQAAENGDAFLSALEAATAGRNEEAADAFAALADEAGTGYQILARLRRAAALADADRREEALAAFDEIALDSKVSRQFRSLANIRAAYLALDGDDFAGATERVEALANANGPWRLHALEVMALADYAAGNLQTARSRFSGIGADTAAPPTLRRRASVFVALIDAHSDGAVAGDAAPEGEAQTN